MVLPSKCFAEKEGTFSNTERRVQRVRKAVDAPGQAMDDWKITTEIATRMGVAMSYADSREIMEELAAVTPSYAGIDYDRIDHEGIHWPCPTKDHPGHRSSTGNSLQGARDFFMPSTTRSRPRTSTPNIPCS